MWPKALAQLIELAPHIGRLLPVADRFLQSRASNEDGTNRALDQIGTLRGDLGRVAATHEGLYRQLNDQAERLASISEQATAARAAAEAAEDRAGALERRLNISTTILSILLPLNMVLLALVILLVMRH